MCHCWLTVSLTWNDWSVCYDVIQTIITRCHKYASKKYVITTGGQIPTLSLLLCQFVNVISFEEACFVSSLGKCWEQSTMCTFILHCFKHKTFFQIVDRHLTRHHFCQYFNFMIVPKTVVNSRNTVQSTQRRIYIIRAATAYKFYLAWTIAPDSKQTVR